MKNKLPSVVWYLSLVSFLNDTASEMLYPILPIFITQVLGAPVFVLGIIEGVAGILLVIGLWTQVAALVVFVDLVIRLVERIMKKAFLTDGVNYYLVLLVMAISLMVTGAGWIAFDLPL